LSQGVEVLGPGLRAGRNQHRANSLVAEGLAKEPLPEQLGVALELDEQPSVAALDVGSDDLEIERQALASGWKSENDCGVRDDEAGVPAGSLSPVPDLAPERRLGLDALDLNVSAAAARGLDADQEVGGDQIVLEERGRAPGWPQLRELLALLPRLLIKSRGAGRRQAVDGLTRPLGRLVHAVEDERDEVPVEHLVLPELAETDLEHPEADIRAQNLMEMVAAHESVFEHRHQDCPVAGLENQTGGLIRTDEA